jgi:hypothetical protein
MWKRCVTLRSAISTACLLTYGRHEHERALKSAEPPADLSYFLGVFTGLEETAGLSFIGEGGAGRVLKQANCLDTTPSLVKQIP